jgi:predicted transcriptional regulator
MKDLTPILRSLGLLDSETKAYLAALETGPSTVIDLANHINLSRQAVYLAIESLTKRGLMTSATHDKKKLYAAERPARLLEYAKRHRQEMDSYVSDLETAVPELELRMGGERPTVKVYEGKEGILAIIEDMQRSKPKQSDEIADLDAMYAVLTPEDLLPMRSLMKRLGVKIQGIYTGHAGERITNVIRQMLPKEYSGFQSNITVYENKVALVTFKGKMQSILIESEPLAKTFRVLFRLAYQSARDISDQ